MIKLIFSLIWRRWLYNDFTGKQCKVVRVTGWNSCVLDTPSGSRQLHEFIGYPWSVKNQKNVSHI